MDDLTQQSIAAQKQIGEKLDSLHSDLPQLTDSLQNLKDAIDAKRQSYEKSCETPPVTVAELRTQVPIRVETKTQHSKIENVWRVLKGALEAVGIVAVVIYSGVAYENWQEQIDATNFAGIQAAKARQTLNETIKNFRIDQRAWISTGMSMPPIELNKPILYTIWVNNTGKTFAERVTSRIFVTFSDRELNERELLGASPKGAPNSVASVAMIVPNSHNESKDVISATEVPRILNRLGHSGYIYLWGDVSYRDIFKAGHVTEYCGYRAASATDFLQCKFHTDAD